jgi:hypothetical protein
MPLGKAPYFALFRFHRMQRQFRGSVETQSFTTALIPHHQNLKGHLRERDKERSAEESGPEEEIMSDVLAMNIPLMVLAFALWVAIPLWLVARRADWRGRPEARTVPAYMARRATPIRAARVRLPRVAGYDGRLALRPLSSGANG